MRCPKCKSTDTRKPSVREARWKLGTQICNDCDHQDDWIRFIKPSEQLTAEKIEKAAAATEELMAPLRKILDP